MIINTSFDIRESIPEKVFFTHAAVNIEVIANDFDRKSKSKEDIFFLSNAIIFNKNYIQVSQE